ncbi:MAG: alpha-2-macroglobulin family protein, partial [Myxococcales bacterium]
MRNFKLAALALAAAASMGCRLAADEQAAGSPTPALDAVPAEPMRNLAGASMERRKAKMLPTAPGAGIATGGATDGFEDSGGSEGEGTRQAATPSRAWFPETFLFDPLVVTDEQGKASVPVRVPDRLTSWRVLALAHSRDGAQAGAVA